MWILTLSTKKPRNEHDIIPAGTTKVIAAAGIRITVLNSRETPVYLKWRI